MIDNIVYDCIKEHVGGEKFFDALDELIRQEIILFPVLTELAISMFSKSNLDKVFITSGKFGKVYGKWLKLHGYDSVILEGSLRNNDIKDMDNYKLLLCGKESVFVDDSYFLGRTQQRVQRLVEMHDGIYKGTVVAYDGSKSEKKKDLISLFRYYDNIDIPYK